MGFFSLCLSVSHMPLFICAWLCVCHVICRCRYYSFCFVRIPTQPFISNIPTMLAMAIASWKFFSISKCICIKVTRKWHHQKRKQWKKCQQKKKMERKRLIAWNSTTLAINRGNKYINRTKMYFYSFANVCVIINSKAKKNKKKKHQQYLLSPLPSPQLYLRASK